MSDQRYKADAGKPQPDLLQVGMARALRIVQATMEYGALKYEAHSWRKVPNAAQRYFKAAERHRQERLLPQKDERPFVLSNLDEESGLPHLAHEIFNLLALLELALDAEPYTDLRKLCEFKQPPTGHKE